MPASIRRRIPIALLMAVLMVGMGTVSLPSSPGAEAGAPHPAPGCPGDVDGTRDVNATDILGVAQHYGIQGMPGDYDAHFDMDGNTAVNSVDLLFVSIRFGPCPFTVLLSDLPTTGTPANGFGPFERDQSNGEDSAGDGGALTISSVVYPKGLGVHAASNLLFTMPAVPGNACTVFAAQVGVDDEVGANGSVIFEVWNHDTNTRLYQSPVKTGADAATAVNVPLATVSTLRLAVTTNGPDAFDHADWADAKVTCNGGDFTAPNISAVAAAPATTSAAVTWNTNEIANSQVQYGLTDTYGSTSSLGSLFTQPHSRAINGLAPNTTYHYRVLSRDPAGNLATSPDHTFTTSASTGLFGDPAPFSAGVEAHGVFIADLNGDTNNDVVTANAGSDNISVLLGNGDGTFDPPVHYTTGHQPKSVTLGLINNDAFLDALTANQGTNNVSVLLGNGDGTLDAKTDFAACSGSHEATLALLNADAFLDIACAGWGASQAKVLLGNGSGGFAAAVAYTVGSAPHSIVAGDFNSDGKLDLATANHGSANLSVLVGTGTGTFAAHVTYAAGGNGPHSIRAADLNGDGDLDLVSANNQSDNIGILFGNPGAGVGTFQAVTTKTTGQTPKGVAIADINGNGTLDILTANIRGNYPDLINPGGDSVSVFLGNGTGTFGAKTDYTVGQGSFAVATGHLNADTKLDIATANWHDNGSTVRLNTGP